MIEVEHDDSPRANMGRCKELLEAAMSDVLIATSALEKLPEVPASDFEGDICWKALRCLHSAFSKVYRAEQFAHRAWCTAPAEVRDVPVDDSDLEPED